MGRNDQAVTAPVDVLAVLRRVSRHVPNEEFVEFDDALHAVVELIEALSKIAHLNGNDYFDGGVMATRRIARAALARVGGA